MSYNLTVVQPFGKYKKGDHIVDPVEVENVMNGPNAHSIVRRHPANEHANGDFYLTDSELKNARAKRAAG